MIQKATILKRAITPEEYHHQAADRGTPGFALSAHALIEILRNAQRWVRGYESPESKAKKYGELLDCLLLTPTDYQKRFTVLPADAPRKPTKAQINAKKPSPQSVEAIAWWKEFESSHPGEVISDDLNTSVHLAIQRLREDETISDLLDHSRRQVMVTASWLDETTGTEIPLKCLIDLVPHENHPVFSNSLWDLKTTANASPHSFVRDAQNYGYHIQGAFYLAMWNAATSEQRSDFGHVIQENYHPYEYRTPPPLLSQRFLNLGRLMFQRAIEIYCKGIRTGKWPGYDQRDGDWPLTDCADWFLSIENVYSDIQEEPETEEAPEEVPTELTP